MPHCKTKGGGMRYLRVIKNGGGDRKSSLKKPHGEKYIEKPSS